MKRSDVSISIKYVWYDKTSTEDYINSNKFSFCGILSIYTGRIIKTQRQEKLTHET